MTAIEKEILRTKALADPADIPAIRNDAGNAREFINRHGEDLRHVPAWKRWLVWNGNQWREDADGGVYRLAMEHHLELVRDATLIGDENARKAALNHAISLGNASKIDSMLELACYDRRVILLHTLVDTEPDLIGTGNGVIDLRTGEHRPAKKTEYVTRAIATPYDATATCPRWERFVHEVFNGDAGLIEWIHRAVGYTLTGHNTEQVFFFLYGTGSNGKNTFTDALQAILGDYAKVASEGLVKVSNNGREPAAEIAELFGRRLTLASELDQGMKLNENLIKGLTGNDMLRGRRLYGESFDFPATAKLWMSGNHKPSISGTDNGIWRRVRLVPFTRTFADAEKDPTLLPLFKTTEASGILNWMIAGARKWCASGLGDCAAVADAVKEYREEQDTLGDFIEARTRQITGTGQILRHTALFKEYDKWCDDGGMKYRLTSRKLASILRERGWQDRKGERCLEWPDRVILPDVEF